MYHGIAVSDSGQTVDYLKLTAILIEAIKEQQANNEQLSERVTDYESRISKIEALLEIQSQK